MAVYSDNEITADLIKTKFPTVASAIVAEAGEGVPDITADFIKTNHPDIAASFREEGVKEGEGAGANAERERISSIKAVAMPGYEDVVAAAIEDGKSTANDVKLAIYDAMQGKAANAKEAHAKDGKTLADLGAELGGGEGGETSKDKDAKEGENLMANAGKAARGEA